MRKELAEAVAALFAGRRAEPQLIKPEEIKRIDDASRCGQVVELVALDFVPPSRRKAYEYLRALRGMSLTTTAVAKHMALPTLCKAVPLRDRAPGGSE